MGLNSHLQELYYCHLTVFYLFGFYLSGLGKLQEEIFKGTKSTLNHPLGSAMYLYLRTSIIHVFGRVGFIEHKQ